MVIGITGSSGSGKSTICKKLQEKFDVKIIDADEISKKLSQKGSNYVIDIIKTFGEDIVGEDGELRRKKLAEIIYSDPDKRKALNNCTFKYIKEEIIKQLNKIKNPTTAIIDAPLLFESELNNLCDVVIGVIAPREIQIERIVARDNLDYEEAEKRIDAQADNEFFIQHCDVVIENDGNFEKVNAILNEIAEKIGIKKYFN